MYGLRWEWTWMLMHSRDVSDMAWAEVRERVKETVLLGLEGKPINGFSWPWQAIEGEDIVGVGLRRPWGHVLMTSAKFSGFSGFWTNSCNLPYYICFWGTPLPPPTADIICTYMPPCRKVPALFGLHMGIVLDVPHLSHKCQKNANIWKTFYSCVKL